MAKPKKAAPAAPAPAEQPPAVEPSREKKPRPSRKGRKFGRGRPPTLTKAVREAILESVRAGATVTAACEAAGVARSNFYYWKSRAEEGVALYAGFMREIAQAKALFETENVKIIGNAAIEKDWKAAAWLLERNPRTRKRYGAHQRVEHTGAGGGPIPVASVPMEAIEQARAAMAANTAPDDASARITQLEAELAELRARAGQAAEAQPAGGE